MSLFDSVPDDAAETARTHAEQARAQLDFGLPQRTPQDRERIAAQGRARHAAQLDTAVPCSVDPETGRCADLSCPTCWLAALTAPDMLPLPELSATAHQAAHDAWRASWLPYLCRTVTQALHAERAITDAADADALGPQERELLARDPRATIRELSKALAPITDHRPLLHVTGVLADMVRQAESALLDLAAGKPCALRMCSFFYVHLRAHVTDMLGDDVIPAAQLPPLAPYETDSPAVTGMRDVTTREPSPSREDGEW